MSSAAKKNDDDLVIEAVDMPTDRELKLSKNFEDPALDEMLPGMGNDAPEPEGISLSVTEEAADAVHELMLDASGGALEIPQELPQDFPQPEMGSLPLPEPTAAEIPTAQRANPPVALPGTVNPNPDILERSMLISTPEAGDVSQMIHAEEKPADTSADAAMYKMSDALFSLVACERSFDDVVVTALRAIMESVNAYTGSVLELDHQHEDFFFRASSGGTTSHSMLKTFRVPLTKGIVGHVAESGQPLLIRNLAEDEKQMRAISVSVGFDAITCMAAPILVGGQPYGVIEVFNKLDGGHYNDQDLHHLEEGVRMLSKVLEVRFLFAELARRLK